MLDSAALDEGAESRIVATVVNRSAFPQAQWSQPFTVPATVGETKFPAGVAHVIVGDVKLGVAVREWRRGPVEQWVAWVPLTAGQAFTASDMSQPDPPPVLPAFLPLGLHPAWEGIDEVVPKVTVAGTVVDLSTASVEIEDSPAHMQATWAWTGEGLRVEYRCRVYWRSSVASWSVMVQWCPHEDPRWSRAGGSVVLEFAEPVHVPLANARGVEVDGRTATLTLSRLRKGSVYSVRGLLLARYQDREAGDVRNEQLDAEQAAAVSGPISVSVDPHIWQDVEPWGLARMPAAMPRVTSTPGRYERGRSTLKGPPHVTGDDGAFGWRQDPHRDFDLAVWDVLDHFGLERYHYLDELLQPESRRRPRLVTYEGFFGQGGNSFWYGSSPPDEGDEPELSRDDEEHEHSCLHALRLYQYTGDDVARRLVVGWLHWHLHDARILQKSAGMHRAMARRLAPAALAAALLSGEDKVLAESVRDGLLIGIRKAAAADPWLWSFDHQGKRFGLPYMTLMSQALIYRVAKHIGDQDLAQRMLESIDRVFGLSCHWLAGSWQLPWNMAVNAPPPTGLLDPNYGWGSSWSAFWDAAMDACLILRHEGAPTREKAEAVIRQQMPTGLANYDQWRYLMSNN